MEAPLTFSLGGLSKSAGLPHWKLGWIRLGGEASRRTGARRALELIADTYLSAATPVQVALPRILAIAPLIRRRISERCRVNLATASRTLDHSSVDVLAPQGGWTVVLRLPRLCSDEELALRLLREREVLVQPGYFYDFATDGFVVLSLLCDPRQFARGAQAVAAFLDTHIGR
jgi:aspartate/methionine/tyrosine aminotransferase